MRAAEPVHVWVDLTNSWGPRSEPGVLIGWRKGNLGWEGWVIRVSTYSTGNGSAVHVVQSWIPAPLIRRAATDPPRADISQHKRIGG
ncbi:hypothetical protein AB3X52_04160 [Nocardioides sp. DS6]|uniref:Uncharacterized protein n=1 Tax=Nocardioides eburneus TaxID=3231482 RepID=A0ABV3SXR9_9ACTN